MKRICVTILMLTTVVSAGYAAGINVAWNDCVGAGGASNKSFACNTNVGSNALVFSFDPPEGITKLTGGSAWVDLATNAMPDYWRLAAGACRDGVMQLSFDPGTCADPWAGAAVGSFIYRGSVSGHPNVARVEVSWSVPEAVAGPVSPGWEYTAFRLVIDNRLTVGACNGCQDPVCVGFNGLWLYQPAGMADVFVCNPLFSDLATWQGGFVGSGCPGVDQAPLPLPSLCAVTSAVRRSWGQIKSIYR